jgi:hypothetical protein
MPYEFEIKFAPRRTAVSTPTTMSYGLVEAPSTSRMWQAGQAAETASRSSAVSCAQPSSSAG